MKTKEEISAANKASYAKHKDKRKAYGKKYRENVDNKLAALKRGKKYRETQNAKQVARATKAVYRENNKEKVRESARNQGKKNYASNPVYRIRTLIRGGINSIFKYAKTKKNNKTEKILGCSFSELKNYLESKFEPWMNWDNHGKFDGTLNYGWDIDHIVPISSAKTEEDAIKLGHYTNLQPLCSYTNRHIKRNKNTRSNFLLQ